MTDREKALMRVQTSAFAVTEATLFLDTHPGSREALDYYHKAVNEYNVDRGMYAVGGRMQCGIMKNGFSTL